MPAAGRRRGHPSDVPGSSAYGLLSAAVRGAERAVDEQVARQPMRPGGGKHITGLFRRAHRLAPVTDHLDAVIGCQQVDEIVDPGDLRARALVHHSDTREAAAPVRKDR